MEGQQPLIQIVVGYRCVAVEYLDVVIERVCRSGIDLIADGDTDNLLLSESMAVDFPLSHWAQLVDIYGCRCSSLVDHITHRKLSRSKGRHRKPGKELAKRVRLDELGVWVGVSCDRLVST